MKIHSLLHNLTPAQQEAVQTLDGPVLVLAGAGSGKTRVLTHRIAYLLAMRDVSPSRVVAVTFTNKAAREMVERLEHLIGPKGQKIWIGTFHALGLRILRQHASRLGYPSDFAVLDREDQRRLLKGILRDLGIENGNLRQLLDRISQYKQQHFLKSIDKGLKRPYKQQRVQEMDEREQKVVQTYIQRLQELQAMDFDDLLVRVLELFDVHPDVEAYYAQRFTYIHVDEYQDTNRIQYEMLKRWSRIHGNLFAVGDEDQSVYGFRGADIRNVLEFQEDFPGARVIFLEQNFRSTQTILEAANAVITHNRQRLGKTLYTQNPKGKPLQFFLAKDEYEEALAVATLVRHLDRPPGEILILYRTNAQSRALEEAFRRTRIPYKIVGATRFYERKEVKDILAYLRVIARPTDHLALLRILNVPPRGIGPRTLQALHARAQESPLYEAMASFPAPAVQEFYAFLESLREKKERMSVVELAREVIDGIQYEAYIRRYDGDERKGQLRWENVEELLSSMARFAQEHPPGSLDAYLEYISLWTSMDEPIAQDAVTLMTAHMAKGLEFPVVILTGLEETVFPHQNAAGDEIEEERRLFYVALTRAMEEVYLFAAQTRGIRRFSLLEVSRFIHEIPEHLVKPLRLPGFGSDKNDGKEKNVPERILPSASPRFSKGRLVFHATFGRGEVIAVEGDRVKVRFASGVKTILASYLQPV